MDGYGAAVARIISKFHAIRCGSNGASWPCYTAVCAASPFL